MQKLILFDIDDVLFDTNRFKKSSLTEFHLYPDVEKTLAELSQITLLGILSKGNVEFQNKKLIETKIIHFFSKDHLHIVAQKDANLINELKKYKNFDGKIFFVDNLLINLSHAKHALPTLVTIFFNRGRYSNTNQNTKEFFPDITIQNLNDIIPVINSKD